MALIEKMVSNQSWGEERSNKQQKGMHTMKEVDMLPARMDLLMKRLDECTHEKEAMKGTVQAIDSQMTCESMATLDIRGTTASKPMRMPHSSTMGSDKVTVISHAPKEVTIITIQIIIQTKPP
jgi:hypothetical protein